MGTGGWTEDDPRFVPLLAGLREVLPWVHQWYGEYDEEWEGNPAEEFQALLDTGRAERELSEADLVNWRPEKKATAPHRPSFVSNACGHPRDFDAIAAVARAVAALGP
ncbi:DUF7008 domain-containing protein [Streptomyces pseudogriseolus]|uniref:DUF7008 domain-containing protein n=1 Tax=Streptomyces pseudogriseolus TaxID=36817 RepID=UPI003FA25D63